ncbi:MAG: Fe-S cluster assembly protein SufB, partial [Planifilum fimeticola]
MAKELPELSEYQYGFRDKDVSVYRSKRGLSREVVEEISRIKGEPDWMLEFRLKALEQFFKMPMPSDKNSKWFSILPGDLSELNFDDITYYVKPSERQGRSWDEVPEEIKRTFDRLGIPEAERKFLAGVSAQYESEVVYHNMKKELEQQGVIFCDTDTAVKEYPELVREYFGTVVPPTDNKFAALNSAVWSGGSFIYVPKGVRVEIPLQAYFRINSENMGQFERTLIIADEDSFVHYVEGCTAPIYSTDSLHSAVVEIIVKKNARCRYTTIQNWSNNVYNLVTKRAVAYEGAHMEWVDGNIGSKLTMKYPAVIMKGEGAKADVLSIA